MVSRRIKQINSLMRKEISDIILRELNDPRLSSGFVAITEVETASDLKNATIYVTDVSGTLNRQDILKALGKAGGYIHQALFPRLDLRAVPFLHFVWDSSIENGVHMSTLIDSVLLPDATKAQNDDGV